MTQEEFDRVKLELLTTSEAIRTSKNKEYMGNERVDVLTAFKKGAATAGLTPQHYTIALMTKHFSKLVGNAQGKGISDLPEVCSDLINYIVYYVALVKDANSGH